MKSLTRRGAKPPGACVESRPLASVFISYRRSLDVHLAGRIRDRVGQGVDVEEVFRDRESIEAGENWRDRLETAIGSARVCLVLIGRDWLDVTDAAGERRLLQEDDWVRLEIATALRHGVPVVPVLLEGAGLPRAQDLPEDLQGLLGFQAIHLSETRWDADCAELVRRVQDLTGRTAVRTRMRWIAIFIAVASLLDMIGVWIEFETADEVTLDSHLGYADAIVSAGFALLGLSFVASPDRWKWRGLLALFALAMAIFAGTVTSVLQVWGTYAGMTVDVLGSVLLFVLAVWLLKDARSLLPADAR